MKSEKIISIKSKRLRIIRDNLRTLLLCEAVFRQRKINDREVVYLFNKDGSIKLLNERSVIEEKNLGKLQSDWWKIERLKRSSICECSLCKSTNSNMVYDFDSSEWICSTCSVAK